MKKQDKIKPFFKTKFVEIYNTDSQDLSFIPNNSVNLIITSPPYNTGMPYAEYNDERPKEDYLQMLKNVFKECYRVLIKGGKICVVVPSCLAQTRYSKIGFLSVSVHNLLEEIGFLPFAWIYWNKIVNCNKNSTSWGSWLKCNVSIRDIGDEYIIVMAKESLKVDIPKDVVFDITKDEFLKFTINRWEIPPVSSNLHPAVFPEEIPYRLIKLFTWQGAVVLDPFAGIGTTGIIASKLKRKTILVEISKQYCEIMKERFSYQDLF